MTHYMSKEKSVNFDEYVTIFANESFSTYIYGYPVNTKCDSNVTKDWSTFKMRNTQTKLKYNMVCTNQFKRAKQSSNA